MICYVTEGEDQNQNVKFRYIRGGGQNGRNRCYVIFGGPLCNQSCYHASICLEMSRKFMSVSQTPQSRSAKSSPQSMIVLLQDVQDLFTTFTVKVLFHYKLKEKRVNFIPRGGSEHILFRGVCAILHTLLTFKPLVI